MSGNRHAHVRSAYMKSPQDLGYHKREILKDYATWGLLSAAGTWSSAFTSIRSWTYVHGTAKRTIFQIGLSASAYGLSAEDFKNRMWQSQHCMIHGLLHGQTADVSNERRLPVNEGRQTGLIHPKERKSFN